MTAIKYTSVTAPAFADAEGTRINCLVVFPSLGPEPLPYTAADIDPGAEHSEEIFARCIAGDFGPVAPWEEVQPVAGGFDVEATGADDGDFAAAPAPKPRARRKPARPAPIARRAKPAPALAKKRKTATKPPKRKR